MTKKKVSNSVADFPSFGLLISKWVSCDYQYVGFYRNRKVILSRKFATKPPRKLYFRSNPKNRYVFLTSDKPARIVISLEAGNVSTCRAGSQVFVDSWRNILTLAIFYLRRHLLCKFITGLLFMSQLYFRALCLLLFYEIFCFNCLLIVRNTVLNGWQKAK